MDQTTLFELLECSVCMEVLDGTSKVLPCQHTFCRRCLDEIVATKKHLQCPECRMPVNKRVEELPPNILLVRLLETMKTMAHLRGNGSRSAADARQPGSRHGVSKNHKLVSKPSHPCAKALYNYDAQEMGDLTFRRGDVVRLCKQIDENWYLGEIGGQQGYFPATYVEVLVPLPDEVAACKALYDFIIDDGNEKDCLTFQKGEIITVLRRIDDNWAEGKLGDRIGIFPISFVEMNDSAKCLIGHVDPQSAKRSSSLASGQQVAAASSATTSKTMPACSSSSFSPSPPASVAASVVTDTNGSYHPLPLPTAATMQALKVPQTMSHRRPSVGVPTGSADIAGAVTSASCVSTRNKPLPLIYEALYNYKPLKEDEIELKKGECYTVLQKCRDGWFKGRSLSTGVFGIFPGNYVKQIALLPLDDLALVQSSSAPSVTPNHVTASRSTSIGANRHQFLSKGTAHGGRDLDGCPDASSPTVAMQRHRSRPITNITQAQIRNSGNIAMTTVANSPKYLYPGCVGTSSGVGSVCSPTWLNLMTTPNSSTDSGCVPTGGAGPSGRRVQRSATCRARSASRMPMTVVTTNRSSPVSDGLDSEDLRTMLRGLSLKDGSDLSVEYSSNGACLVPTGEMVPVGSGFVSSAELDRMDKRHSLIKRWTSVMAKGRKSSSVVSSALLEQTSGQNTNTTKAPTQEDRCATLSTDASQSSCNQKPVKVSLMKVMPIPLSSAQSKSVGRDLYKCVTPYPAQNENELELKVGDMVYVVRKHDDGWFKGVLQRTGKMGLFPGNFVQNVGSS